MFKPIVLAWIEKTHESIFVSFQNGSNVTTFIGIANGTSISKVGGGSFAAVLKADDVFKVKFHQSSNFWQAAVLATVVGTFGGYSLQRNRDVTAH